MFMGPYEHHSNELPWRESIADVVTIREDAEGHIDLAHLERELARYADRPLRIGTFSAASNVTGILSDTRAISVLLHRHGALAFWDFAAAAPYVDIQMEPRRPAPDGSVADADLDTKDALFISTHKLIGGPGTPGILVARRELFRNRVPTVVGGGTVAFVNQLEHRYLADIEHREEAGTPGHRRLHPRRARVPAQGRRRGGRHRRARARSFIGRAIERWERVPSIEILGDRHARRLSIVSFTRPPRRPVPAPQPGGRAAQRPVRHPVPGRLLVRRALRPPAAGHRPRDVASVRAEVMLGCDGIQPGLGPGELQLLHQRDGVPVHPRRGGAGGDRRLAPRCRSTASTRPAACGAMPAASPGPRCHWTISRTPRVGCAIRTPTTGCPSRRSPGTSPRRGQLTERPPEPATPAPVRRRARGGPQFHELRWFLMPDEAARELAAERPRDVATART